MRPAAALIGGTTALVVIVAAAWAGQRIDLNPLGTEGVVHGTLHIRPDGNAPINITCLPTDPVPRSDGAVWCVDDGVGRQEFCFRSGSQDFCAPAIWDTPTPTRTVTITRTPTITPTRTPSPWGQAQYVPNTPTRTPTRTPTP